MGSERLPGKVLLDLTNGKKTIDFLFEQLKSSNLRQKIIAIPESDNDDILFDFLNDSKIPCYRGSSLDVLDRYYQCAKKFSLSTIVRIPADKPLIDPHLVDKMITIFNSNSYEYVTNFLPLTFPSGTEVEIFSFESLETAWKNAKLPSEREHVTPYFYNNEKQFQIYNYENSENLSNLRYAVDRVEDLELVRLLISRIKTRPILLEDIITQFKIDPKLIEINKNVNYYEGYEKSKNEDIEFLDSKRIKQK